MRNQHGAPDTSSPPAQCHICLMLFKNEGVMKDHMRRKHNFYLSKAGPGADIALAADGGQP